MDPQPLIREYREEDAPGLRACIVELQDHERQIDPRLRSGASIADAYLTQMLDRCRHHAGRIFMLECGGVVAGFVTVFARMPFRELDEPIGEFAFISDLVVVERFRRRGYGRALLQAAEQFARDHKASDIRIGVLSANHPARRLYRQAGFESHIEILSKRFQPVG